MSFVLLVLALIFLAACWFFIIPFLIKAEYLPDKKGKLIMIVPSLMVFFSFFLGMFFYAQPGYTYHTRTIWGQEIAQRGVGFKVKGFGYNNAWKNAMSVQATDKQSKSLNAETESSGLSATISPQRVVFLDQVDAQVSATARWVLPEDNEAFLKIAREYRTPSNLLRTELLPSFEETLSANAALIDAEEYFSGGLTSFNNDFLDQMSNGTYIVERRERLRESVSERASANADRPDNQEQYGDGQQVDYFVERLVDKNGTYLRKKQAFEKFGIRMVSARITGVLPNAAFNKRMELKQKASADRAIAREQRIQEEEQEQLAIAKGRREAAEAEASALVIQVKATTEAETNKKLAITEAEKVKETETLLLEASQIQLDRANIDAKAVKVLADAEAHKKRVILQADNALHFKGEKWLEAQRVWADAYSKRNVPGMIIGQGAGTGTDNDLSAFEAMIAASLAKQLDIDMSAKKTR